VVVVVVVAAGATTFAVLPLDDPDGAAAVAVLPLDDPDGAPTFSVAPVAAGTPFAVGRAAPSTACPAAARAANALDATVVDVGVAPPGADAEMADALGTDDECTKATVPVSATTATAMSALDLKNATVRSRRNVGLSRRNVVARSNKRGARATGDRMTHPSSSQTQPL
jgi:hypothetical protein